MAKNKDTKGEPIATGKAPTFTKEQIVKSERYSHRRDALGAMLNAEKTYSSVEVDEILKKFEGGQ